MAEIRDATAHMTLGAIRKRDEDNLDLILRGSKEHSFPSTMAALYFMGAVQNKILLKFGIDQVQMFKDSGLTAEAVKTAVTQPMDLFHVNVPVSDPGVKALIDKIDKMMADKDLKSERRQYQHPRDTWKSGVYLYHQNEIAYFISEPYQRKGGHYATPHIIVPTFGNVYYVMTNFKG